MLALIFGPKSYIDLQDKSQQHALGSQIFPVLHENPMHFHAGVGENPGHDKCCPKGTDPVNLKIGLNLPRQRSVSLRTIGSASTTVQSGSGTPGFTRAPKMDVET